MFVHSFSVLCFAGALCFGSLTVQGQSSMPSSQPPAIPPQLSEPLWQVLLPLITALPINFKSYQESLTSQIGMLQANELQLQDSNSQLTQENASLQEYLSASQIAAETSQSRSTQLQTALADSIASTGLIKADLQKAQVDAKALEAENGILKVGCIGFGVGLGIVAVLEGGRALHIW